MPRASRRAPTKALAAHPLLLWSQLALRTGEMLLAAGTVIPIRVTRMAVAGHAPDARDRAEFARMVPEKLQAGAASMVAVGARMQAMQLQWMTQAGQQWLRSLGRFGALPGRAPSLAPLGSASADLARLGSAALAPIHAAATANARRLTQGKRRAGAARR